MRRTVKLNLPLHHFAPLNQHFDFPILIPHIRSDSLLSLAYLTTLRIVRYGSPARLCLRHTARSGPLLTRYARSIRGPHLSRRLRRLAPPTQTFSSHIVSLVNALFPLYPLPSKPPPPPTRPSPCSHYAWTGPTSSSTSTRMRFRHVVRIIKYIMHSLSAPPTYPPNHCCPTTILNSAS